MKRLVILTTLCISLMMAGQALAQETGTALCNNNLDDDGDGLVDCRDGGCAGKVCEICDNEIDDDQDGFIDCYDKECLIENACKDFFLGKDALCEVKPDTFPPFEMRLKYKSDPALSNHINRLVVGDVDNDKLPEILSVYVGAHKATTAKDNIDYIETNQINIFQAPPLETDVTLVLDKQYNVPFPAGTTENGLGYEDIAIADIDKDGCSEIFVITKKLRGTPVNYRIFAYHCDGTLVWAAPIVIGDLEPGLLGLADFDGDGLVELYSRTRIYDAHTGTLMGSNNIDNNNTGINFNVNQGWGMNSNAPIAVDIIDTPASPGLELISGCRIYSVAINRGAMTATLTLTHQLSNYATRTANGKSNSTSVADFNQDGHLDVLAIGSINAYNDNTTCFFWDVHNSIVSGTEVFKTFNDFQAITNYTKGWTNGAGRINIADIDGDTLMNAVYVSGKYMYALKEGPTGLEQLWRQDVIEETSGITGCTMFDFNADGKSEIVYRDEENIYIFTTQPDGSVTKTSQVCKSRTSNEYPIVVDMDGDGASEICVTCSTNSSGTRGANLDIWDQSEIRVFESANEPWVPARRVWNQHGYFVANVNDDLSIPKKQQAHHLVYAKNAQCRKFGSSRPLNSFLNQAPYLNSFGCPSYPAPNLTMIPFPGSQSIQFTPPICPDGNFNITFRFANLGDLAISGSLPITMYNGDPRDTVNLAEKITTTNLNLINMQPGDTITTTVAVPGPGSRFVLYVVLNDDGTTIPLNINAQTKSIRECDYDNILSADVIPLPAPLTTEFVENFKCDPAAPDNGVGRVYVFRGGVRDSTNFDFYWFDGPPDTTTMATHVGHVYAQRPAGAYSVYAIHKVAGCGSDTATVNIPLTAPNPPVITIDELNPYDNCKNPNGVLKANVDGDGDGTFDPTGNFTYLWQSPGLDTLGISHTVTGLGQGLGYIVTVTDKATGCSATQTEDIDDLTVTPVPTIDIQDIDCSSTPTGYVRATVGTTTAGYTFRWYNGNSVKPVADFTGANYNNRPGGNYTLVVEDNSSKCESTPITVTVAQTPPIVVNVDSKTNQTSCDTSDPNGSAVATVNSGLVTGYNFEWFTGQNTTTTRNIFTNTIDDLPFGVYTVKATDPLTGCFDTDTVNVLSRVVIPALTASGSPMRKCEPLDGEVTAIPNSGNIADYTFTWYDGPVVKATTDYPTVTGNVLGSLKPGIYTVKAFNNVTRCEAIADSALVRNLTPTINITVIPNPAKYPLTCSSYEGEISATVSSAGNTNGFQVDWYRGVRPLVLAEGDTLLKSTTFTTNPVLDNLTKRNSGMYTISVINEDDNCRAFKEYFLPSKTTDSLSITGLDLTQCTPVNGEITATLIPNLSNPVIATKDDFRMRLFKLPSNTQIEQIDGPVNPSLVFNFQDLDSGRYYVLGEPLSNVCAVISEPFEIKWEPIYPTLNLDSMATTSCVGTPPNGQVIANATGPAVLNYEFFRGNNNTTNLINPIGTANVLNGQLSGFYTTRVTAGNGCTNVKSIFVPSDSSILVADAVPVPRVVCNILDGSVTVNNITEMNFSGSTTNAYNPATYNVIWPIADSNPATENILEALDSGTYTLQVVNTSTGCISDLVSARVEDLRVYPTIDLVDFTVPTVCRQPINEMGMLQVTAHSDGVTTYSYTWYPGLTTTVPPVATDSIAQNLTQGIYTIEVINDLTFCPRIDSFKLPLDTALMAIQTSAMPMTFCSSGNGEIFATISSADPSAYSYNWYYITSLPLPAPADFNGRYAGGLLDSTYVVVATDLSDANCFISDTVRVEDERIFPIVTAMVLSPNTICDNTNPDGIVAANVGGDDVNYTFDWYGNPMALPSFITGSQISNLHDSTYHVIATHIVTGCSDTTSTIVDFAPRPLPPPTIEILSQITSCSQDNGALAVSVNGITQGFTFNWYDGRFETLAALPLAPNATGETYDSLAIGFYTVTATDNYTKCITNPAFEELIYDRVYPEFELEVIPASCEEENGQIKLTITNDVVLDSIVWEMADGTLLTLDEIILVGIPEGDYKVTVYSQLDCPFEQFVHVGTEIRPFNGISRNNDGKNDYFHINCIESFENNIVRIYNRVGTLVFERENYKNAELDLRFDGHANKGITPMGNNLPDGTYYFIIDKRNGSKPIAGYLEIVN
ncbi:MAG TPA: gliding motility-associated C-terminal domain-containing protein [Ohtaekwangia sp.]